MSTNEGKGQKDDGSGTKKIAVVGIGYVGLSNAVVLAQHNDVTAVNLSSERVDMVTARKSPIVDPELEGFLSERTLSLNATTDLKAALVGVDIVLIATPTDYDPIAIILIFRLSRKLQSSPHNKHRAPRLSSSQQFPLDALKSCES